MYKNVNHLYTFFFINYNFTFLNMLGKSSHFGLLLVSCALFSFMVTKVDAFNACCVDPQTQQCLTEKTETECLSAGLNLVENSLCDIGDLDDSVTEESRQNFAKECGGDELIKVFFEDEPNVSDGL